MSRLVQKIFPRIGLLDLLGVFLGLTTLYLRGTWARDPGLGWHLRAGEWMLKYGEVLRLDPFLLSPPDRTWVNNQWLSDIVFWFGYEVGGFPLLHILALGLCVWIFTCILGPLLLERSASRLLVCLIILLSAFLGSVQWTLRPVIFSFCLFAVVYRIVVSERHLSHESTWSRAFVCLPILFCLWVNLHPGFVLGLIVLGVHAATSVLNPVKRGKALLVFFACLISGFVNPYGSRLYGNIVGLGSSEYFMNLNAEWLSIDFYNPLFVPFFFAVVVLMFAVGWGERRRLDVFHLVLLGFFLLMSIMQRRYVPFFAMVWALPVLELLSGRFDLFQRRFSFFSRVVLKINEKDLGASAFRYSAALFMTLLLFVTIFSHVPFRSASYSGFHARFPKQAFESIKQVRGAGAIFHTPNWGGYVIWVLWPRQRAFIDDRNQLNTEARYKEYFQAAAGRSGWRSVFEKHDFRWAVLRGERALRLLLEAEPGWELFFDDEFAVFRKRDLISADSDEVD